MLRLMLIFLGSGFGGMLRHGLTTGVQRLVGPKFPVGTLIVNVTGCLLIGLLSGALAGRVTMREELRIALTVGILGGFTTFSAFGLETFALMNHGHVGRAAANVALSVGLGLAAVWVGHRLSNQWLGV